MLSRLKAYFSYIFSAKSLTTPQKAAKTFEQIAKDTTTLHQDELFQCTNNALNKALQNATPKEKGEIIAAYVKTCTNPNYNFSPLEMEGFYINMQDANLENADLENANLKNANLENSILINARDLDKASNLTREQLDSSIAKSADLVKHFKVLLQAPQDITDGAIQNLPKLYRLAKSFIKGEIEIQNIGFNNEGEIEYTTDSEETRRTAVTELKETVSSFKEKFPKEISFVPSLMKLSVRNVSNEPQYKEYKEQANKFFAAQPTSYSNREIQATLSKITEITQQSTNKR